MQNYNKTKNFVDNSRNFMIGDGIRHKGNNFITHTRLHHKDSAVQTIYIHQKIFLGLILLILIGGFIFSWRNMLIILIAALTLFYLFDFLFNFFLATKILRQTSEIQISEKKINELIDSFLPVYTIFCPLYKEWQVIPQFIEAISQIDWPKEKLDVQLLLEEDDRQTIAEVNKMNLPYYFNVIVTPDGEPKTKPKACNYGLNYAKGEYAVIYDAEDKPDPDQLKKAFLAFQEVEKEKVVCIQAKLNFYNVNQNLLTRLFAMDYALWFGIMLPGLQSIKAPIPLGGTSNHFRTKHLHSLNGWDPFNVTEDCDLGMRIAKLGLRTAVLDSMTMEEATSQMGNWIRQRSRWIKGYMQTYLVHMRRPGEFISGLKFRDIIFFQVVIGGKVLSLFINPLLWVLTVVYVVFNDSVGPIIESLYLTPIYYMAIFSFMFGNFFYLYNYMIGCAKMGQWGLIKYVILVPVYWLLMSIAAWKALVQLIFRPHYWEKTTHGAHLKQDK